MSSNPPQPQPQPNPPTDYTKKAGNWAVSDDIAQMASEFGKFCDAIVALSLASPPPGANAANGYFAKNMVSDASLSGVAPPRVTPHSDESAAIFRFTADFEQGLRSAFMPGSVKSNWTKSAALFIDFVNRFGDKVGTIATEIGSVFLSNAAIGAVAAKVAADVKALKDEIDKSGVKFEGENANGWIQENVKKVAESTQAAATALKVGKSSEAVNYLDTMSKICEQLKAIPQFDNDPWLVGAWQLAFQGVMGVAGGTLKQFPATLP